MKLRFAKSHHQIPLEEKVGVALGRGELPEIWGFLFNISATAEASDFKFGMQLGLPMPIIKSHPEEKVGVALGYGSSSKFWGSPIILLQRLGLATSNLACCWGLPRPIIKSHAEESLGIALG